MEIEIPRDVEYIIQNLMKYGHYAYVVGGCVRDSLLNITPKDWDICTSALPKKIIEIFKNLGLKVIPTGIKHGTVTILKNNNSYEVTTFRIDGKYTDNRRPSNVKFTNDITEDLKRRDFTINAMAYNDKVGLIDPFSGKLDLNNKVIKCVGKANERFKEDALRILRGVRFSSQLKFKIDNSTIKAMKENKYLLENISKERIREELNKILLSDKPSIGLNLIKEIDVLEYIIPELNECVDFEQNNPNHDKDIFRHILCVVNNVDRDLILRLAALLHDIGKPRCYSQDEKGIGHFYGHQNIGAQMSREILRRLKYDKKTIKRVSILVKEHMSKFDLYTDKAAKRLINRVGKEDIFKLFKLQVADVKGSSNLDGLEKVNELKKLCENIINRKQPINKHDLAIDGYDLIKMGIPQGKMIKRIKEELLEVVLDDSKLNRKDKLKAIVVEKYKNCLNRTKEGKNKIDDYLK